MLELLITICLIGVLMVAIAPSFQSVLADHRQVSGMWEIVRQARIARWRSIAEGVPYMIDFTGANPALGTLKTYRGMGTRCDQVAWNTEVTAIPTRDSDRFLFDWINPRGSSATDMTTTGRFVIYARATVGSTSVSAVRVCYQPNGDTYIQQPLAAQPNMMRQTATSTVRIRVQRQLNGTVTELSSDNRREVVFAAGETPEPAS